MSLHTLHFLDGERVGSRKVIFFPGRLVKTCQTLPLLPPSLKNKKASTSRYMKGLVSVLAGSQKEMTFL